MWREEISSMMIDDYLGIIDYLPVQSVGNLETKLGIFPGPKMSAKAKRELGYEVPSFGLERYEANRLVRELIDLIYRLKVAGDLLYSAKNEDWQLPEHFEFARETLGEAEETVSNLERDGLLLLDD